MKKFIVWILMVLIATSLIGCGTKNKIKEETEETIVEKVIEEAGGGDVDIDGETITIKGEDGQEMIFGNTDWPTSDLAKYIPEFKDGNIVTVMEMNNSLLITLENVSEKDFTDYQDSIKNIFNENSYEMKSEGGVTYGADNGKEIGIMLLYVPDESFSISVQKLSE
jgi:hypothetical protein